MKRLTILMTVMTTLACVSPNGQVTSQAENATSGTRSARVDPATRLCVTLQVHREVYQPDYPDEWIDLSLGFLSVLAEMNRAGNHYALSEQSGQSILPSDASSCSRFPGYVTVAAKYFREPGERLPVFEYTMEGGGTVDFERITRRYVDEDIADPALNQAPGPGGRLRYAFRLVLERRSKAILDELAGKEED